MTKKTAKRVLKRLVKFINKRYISYDDLVKDPTFTRCSEERFKVISISQELKYIIDVYHKITEEEEEKEVRI